MEKQLRNGLILATIGFAGYEIHRLSQFRQGYTIVPGPVNLSLAGDKLNINTTLGFRNNSTVDVELKSVHGTLIAGGSAIGVFHLDKNALLKAQNETPIVIRTEISGKQVLQNLVQMAQSKKLMIRYRVTVGVKAAFFFTVPISVTEEKTVDFNTFSSVIDQVKSLFTKR